MDIGELLRHASQHHGLLCADVAEGMGVSRNRLDRLRSRGLLTLEGNGVYRVVGSQATWRQQVLCGVLATGPMAFASHRSAAALWGVTDGRRAEVVVPMGTGARSNGIVVHQTRHLVGVDVDERHGIPVTSIERTLIDLAAVVPMGRVARALDEAHNLELTTYTRLQHRLDAMPTRGRKGVRVLRVLLEERIGTPADSANPFETRMAGILGRSELPEASRQQLLQSGEHRYFIDFAWPRYMVAVECDGLGSHGTPAAMSYDLTRQNAIIEAGWNLRRFPWSDVRFQPAETLETIRRALLANGWSHSDAPR